MSYEMVKQISIRSGKITLTTAPNNVYPTYYERWEYAEEKSDKEFFLFLDLLHGNLRVTTLNCGTIKYAYAIMETCKKMAECQGDLRFELYLSQDGKDETELKEMYKEWYNFYRERMKDDNSDVYVVYGGYLNVTIGKYGRDGYQRFKYGGKSKKYPKMQAKIFLNDFKNSDYDLKIIE